MAYRFVMMQGLLQSHFLD